MKCTDKTNNTRRKNIKSRAARRRAARKKRIIRQMMIIFMSIIMVVILSLFIFAFTKLRKKPSYEVSEYENKVYTESIANKELFSKNLCVTDEDVKIKGLNVNEVHGEALFDVTDNKVIYGQNIFEKLYPASTTKILTAYVTLKYGDLNDIVTISSHAVDMPSDAQVCGLKAGDTIKLYDLLSGLILYSGNDAAISIAEHISGSTEEFVALMNEEAAKLGATNTHFVNPHGLHDDNHYTTIYDLYLIFNACLKYDDFNDIYSHKSYTATVTDVNGEDRSITWIPTNQFSSGESVINSDFENHGGKTGTTMKAGSCLVLSTTYKNGKQCISIVMGANDKPELYDEMNNVLEFSKSEL